jgi:hypothetical protein
MSICSEGNIVVVVIAVVVVVVIPVLKVDGREVVIASFTLASAVVAVFSAAVSAASGFRSKTNADL